MTTSILTAVGATPPSPIRRLATNISLPPGIIVNLSAGASLTYTVEITGDALDATGYNAANGIWNPFDGMVGLSASANGTLSGAVTGIRCRIISYTSGTLTFQVTGGQ